MFIEIKSENDPKKPKIELNAINNALKMNTRNMPIWFNLGLAYKYAKMFEKSIEIFKYLLQIEPKNIKTLNALGEVYLENFDYEVIRKFQRDWYRPDLMAVVAVGDFDVSKMEAKIKEKFSGIAPRPDALWQ